MCEYCKSKGIYSTEDIEVHHIEKIKYAPTKAYDDDNLICLCEECHEKAERGEIPADTLKALVVVRDAEYPGGI